MSNRSIVRLSLLQIAPRVIGIWTTSARHPLAFAIRWLTANRCRPPPTATSCRSSDIPERAQTDESLSPSNADLVGSNRARVRWSRISVALLALLLAEPAGAKRQEPLISLDDVTIGVSGSFLPASTAYSASAPDHMSQLATAATCDARLLAPS
jgi:hypothetical protein